MNARTILCLVLGCFLSSSALGARKQLQGVVNLNTATAAELQLLPGVGPAKAEQILAYRKQRPFRTIEELARIKGIGRKTVNKLRPHLTVSGPTTATVGAAPVAQSADD